MCAMFKHRGTAAEAVALRAPGCLYRQFSPSPLALYVRATFDDDYERATVMSFQIGRGRPHCAIFYRCYTFPGACHGVASVCVGFFRRLVFLLVLLKRSKLWSTPICTYGYRYLRMRGGAVSSVFSVSHMGGCWISPSRLRPSVARGPALVRLARSSIVEHFSSIRRRLFIALVDVSLVTVCLGCLLGGKYGQIWRNVVRPPPRAADCVSTF